LKGTAFDLQSLIWQQNVRFRGKGGNFPDGMSDSSANRQFWRDTPAAKFMQQSIVNHHRAGFRAEMHPPVRR
jgi:hypothetical protein